MFVCSMNAVDDLPAMAKIITEAELKFVIVQAHWQYSKSTKKVSTIYNWPDAMGLKLKQSYGCSSTAEKKIEKMLEMGLKVLPFSYPVPDQSPDEVVDVLSKYAEAWESPSVLIDPELEWSSKSGSYKDEALVLSAKMCQAFPSWGMSTYGAPWFWRTFPYAEFKSACYGIPQTYGVTSFGTDESMKRAHDEWRKYGFPYLVGAYGTYDKTDGQFTQLMQVVANQNPPATIGWEWGKTGESEWEHIDTYLPR
jgi:hypothetical protein